MQPSPTSNVAACSQRRFLQAILLLYISLVNNQRTRADVIGTDMATSSQEQQSGPIVGPTLGAGQPVATGQPQQEPAVVIQQRASGPDILVATSDGSSSERHHYEQQPLQDQLMNQDGPKPLAQLLDVPPATPVPSSTTETSNYQGPQKPEPRNQQDEPVQQPAQQQQDPAIIDHRPAPGQQDLQQQQQEYTQPPVTQPPPTTTQAPILVQLSTQASVQQQQIHYQATQAPLQTPPATQAPPVAAGTSWYQPVNFAQQQQQPRSAGPVQQQQQYGQQQPQQVTVSQHPTSINAIINEQQQQPIVNQPLAVQQTNSIQGQATAASQPSHQVVTINGQPMILMNPNAASGGRRISLSGWLKNLSSMLANIFNRREHGILGGNQPQMAGNSPLGHWVSLSGASQPPQSHSSPHWLSTAQTVAQQQQYQQQYQQQQQQQQAMGSTRYATYVQAPPQQATSYQPQPQMQLQPQTPQQQHQQVELQASASSTIFSTVPPPVQIQPQPQIHHQATPVYQSQPQQVVQIGSTAPASMSHSNLPAPTPIVGQPPRQSVPSPQAQSQPQPQQQQSPTQPQPMLEQQQQTVVTQLPLSQQVRATLAPVQQQGPRYGRSSATGSGLPLAHYSRYAGTQD